MRRPTVIATFVLLAGLLLPARADAQFWKWIDDLSGPQYIGFEVDWRVWCAAKTPPKADEDQKVTVAAVGLVASICPAKKGDRWRAYMSVNYGFAWDTKDPPEQGQRMTTFGVSFHGVPTPPLTIGAGAGLAWFSSNEQDSFKKFYLQPFIVDVRPQLWINKRADAGPWWHAPYLRVTGVTFPAGFEPGRFVGPAGPSGRYGAEFVFPVFGVFLDLEPLLRKASGTW